MSLTGGEDERVFQSSLVKFGCFVLFLALRGLGWSFDWDGHGVFEIGLRFPMAFLL